MRSLKQLAALAAAVVCASAQAGTYSIVDIEWYPATIPGTGSDGGSISLINGSTHDLAYSLVRSVGSENGTVTAHPTAVGLFQWRVQWVPSGPDDPIPVQVTAKVEIRSTKAQAGATALSYISSATATASADVSDPYFPMMASATATSPYPYYTEQPYSMSDPVTSTESPDMYTATGECSEVSPGVYQGFVGMAVNTQASLSATGSLEPGGYQPYAIGGASCDLEAKLRLTEVEGQTVQPEL